MSTAPGGSPTPEITVRYWAAARAAAGVAEDRLPVDGEVTLDDVVRRVLDLHPDGRMSDLVKVCSVLVGDQPAGTREPQEVAVPPGATVEFLPPFAGG